MGGARAEVNLSKNSTVVPLTTSMRSSPSTTAAVVTERNHLKSGKDPFLMGEIAKIPVVSTGGEILQMCAPLYKLKAQIRQRDLSFSCI